MPGATSDLHLDMYYTQERTTNIYGSQWGDPEDFASSPGLAMVKNHFILPYVREDVTVAEIGPGGGRWTQYFRPAKHVYIIDPFEQMLNETKIVFGQNNITAIQNSGTDFPGIPEGSINYLFTFDVFVHLDLEVIEQYLINAKKILHDHGTMFIHYGDKTKYEGAQNIGYAWNSPVEMNKLLKKLGLAVIAENTTCFNNSAFVLVKKGAGELYCPSGTLPLLPKEEYEILK